MKSLYYFFRHYRLPYVLNLLGLGIALAAVYLFLTQVKYNSTYNHSIPNYDRMVRLENRGIEMNGEWSCHVCRPFEQLASASSPAATRHLKTMKCWK